MRWQYNNPAAQYSDILENDSITRAISIASGEDYDVALLQEENRALNEENDKLVKKQTELQSQLDYVEIMRDFYESKANILEKAIILLYDRRN